MNVRRNEATVAGARSMARLAAIQALYQLDMTDLSVDKVVGEFAQYRLGGDLDGAPRADADRSYFDELVRNASADCADLDRIIGDVLAPEWPLHRLDRVLKAMLRLGGYELRNRLDVPARVVISEYVDIARSFFDGKELGLVNGVLDRMARTLRREEFEGQCDGRE
ncbi:MAG: transcription antitermination factor NusB [Alphaproteobacteria bacterium]|nr:transcription antitermination factor NusB [Alphaproteobacteria bacterium]